MLQFTNVEISNVAAYETLTEKFRDVVCRAGHSYLTKADLVAELSKGQDWSGQDTEALLEAAVLDQVIVEVEGRYYLPAMYRAETILADFVSDALRRPPTKLPPLSSTMSVNGVPMNKEQNRSVRMALSHRVSVVTGGAGTGKTTIIQAIVQGSGEPQNCLLCAFTSRAAQNITDGTGLRATTIHGALGVCPNGDLTQPNRDLSRYHTIIVDEASMLTLKLLAGIVAASSDDCRIVLVGDAQQLPPVGGGDILHDFYDLGVPCVKLKTIYRQADRETALFHNVSCFHKMRNSAAFHWDNSFQLFKASEEEIEGIVTALAVHSYQSNPSTVVLSPVRKTAALSAPQLNRSVQIELNSAETPSLLAPKGILYDRDRVMFLANNRAEQYYNGQMGILESSLDEQKARKWNVRTASGEMIPVTEKAMQHLEPAYAMTVHKAQGSSFDVVILPLSMKLSTKMTRNMLYTALTRAKKRVLLVGDPSVLDYALMNSEPERNSVLVDQVQELLYPNVG